MELKVGKITHYFGKISVAVIEITDEPLSIGDKIHIKGISTDFSDEVTSMQIENQPVEQAKKGDSIGLKVKEKAKNGDIIYKVIE